MAQSDGSKKRSSRGASAAITEEPIDAELLGNIKACAAEAAELLGFDAAKTPPATIVEAVDEFIYDWQKGKRPPVDPEADLSLSLGSLWGEQLVKTLGWEWTSAIFHEHDESSAVGVVSPDRSLAIYPFHFVYGSMENNAPVTIMLSYNMLLDRSRIPDLPAGGFENVMDNVHHIVPRD